MDYIYRQLSALVNIRISLFLSLRATAPPITNHLVGNLGEPVQLYANIEIQVTTDRVTYADDCPSKTIALKELQRHKV
jgi:hypothetical protein